jgi:hypothetical protein
MFRAMRLSASPACNAYCDSLGIANASLDWMRYAWLLPASSLLHICCTSNTTLHMTVGTCMTVVFVGLVITQSCVAAATIQPPCQGIVGSLWQVGQGS